MKKMLAVLFIALLYSCTKSDIPIPVHFRVYWELHQYEDKTKPVISLTYIGIIDSSERRNYDTTLVPLGCTTRDSARWAIK